MIEGVPLSLGGKIYIVAALSLGQIRKHETDLELINQFDKKEPFGEKRLQAITRVVHAALSRNYPDVKLEQVDDLLDLNNMKHVVDSILGLSGLTRVTEESPPGED